MTHRLLSVAADLMIELDNEQIRVRGDGCRIVVEVPSVRLVFRSISRWRKTGSIRGWFALFSRILTRADLTMTVRTPGRRLVTIGRDDSSWLLRLLGVPNTRIHLI